MPTIYTHGGDFHSDELVAIALIQQFACPGEPVELVRTRNKDCLAEALADETAYVVDVGLTHDPDRLNFDHHQEGGADAWEDGLPKSSCGLVWTWLRDTGRLDALSPEACDRMERDFIRPIDAHDNGVDRWPWRQCSACTTDRGPKTRSSWVSSGKPWGRPKRWSPTNFTRSRSTWKLRPTCSGAGTNPRKRAAVSW